MPRDGLGDKCTLTSLGYSVPDTVQHLSYLSSCVEKTEREKQRKKEEIEKELKKGGNTKGRKQGRERKNTE
jgi:hypothetical protein